MKKYISNILASLILVAALTSCEGEKDLIIIEGNLPIKSETLYMVGDATPNGWSIDSPTPLEAIGDDPLVFCWEGTLYKGEIKLCLTPGSWDAPFIRPIHDGDEIGANDLSNVAFQMHAGDPDEKWHVVEAGTYHLTFDLRNWTMSSAFLGGMEAPAKDPIPADALYIVGDATPTGWNIDSPTLLTRTADYIFEYEGELYAGELKACTEVGSWDVPFVRPESEGVLIGKDGIGSDTFMYIANPDNKWRVTDSGVYHITFDLENYTIKTEYKGEIKVDNTPIESETLYMIGDATPGGWSMDDATAFTVSASNKYIFTWEGDLVQGNMKACLEPDPTFSCPFLRPEAPGCKISSAGVESSTFVYTVAPDDQWQVVEAGKYKVSFDLEHRTISVEFISGGSSSGNENGNDEESGDDKGGSDDKAPLESETLYMIGDATPGGWSMDDATALTPSADDKYIFSWTGTLEIGEMKACLTPDGTFSCPFVRPTIDGCVINENGVASPDFVYTTSPDNKWRVEKAGKYTIMFNFKSWTIEAKYLD